MKNQCRLYRLTLHDNSTGKLSGTILVHFFSLNGNGKAYVEPDISGIILGNEDVFGTFKK